MLMMMINYLPTSLESILESEAGESGVSAGGSSVNAGLLWVHQALSGQVVHCTAAVLHITHAPPATQHYK
jgi:hypothetical protein